MFLVLGKLNLFKPFNNQCSHHIETSQFICRANQLTGFYMMGTLVVKRLSRAGAFSDDLVIFHEDETNYLNELYITH